VEVLVGLSLTHETEPLWCIGGARNAYKMFTSVSEDNFRDLGVDGGAIFHSILDKHVRIRTGPVPGPVTGVF
jgi:hypothetical protein